MALPINGWKNKKGTSNRSCSCGSWKQHWVYGSGKSWPAKCCISGCSNSATLGAHIINSSSSVCGEYIVPACDSCNKLSSEFSLMGGITLVSANMQKTCEQ